jgi:hypothetical protein
VNLTRLSALMLASAMGEQAATRELEFLEAMARLHAILGTPSWERERVEKDYLKWIQTVPVSVVAGVETVARLGRIPEVGRKIGSAEAQ